LKTSKLLQKGQKEKIEIKRGTKLEKLIHDEFELKD
jgi:hypothetical protein